MSSADEMFDCLVKAHEATLAARSERVTLETALLVARKAEREAIDVFDNLIADARRLHEYSAVERYAEWARTRSLK